jgi:hypothetical protein
MCDADQAEYFYRFLGLNDEQLADLQGTCSAHPIESKWNEEKQGYVVCVALPDQNAVHSVQSYLSAHDLSSVPQGVYVSLVTDSDQAGFTVPDHVLALLRENTVTLDVSFTVV